MVINDGNVGGRKIEDGGNEDSWATVGVIVDEINSNETDIAVEGIDVIIEVDGGNVLEGGESDDDVSVVVNFDGVFDDSGDSEECDVEGDISNKEGISSNNGCKETDVGNDEETGADVGDAIEGGNEKGEEGNWYS